jgi:hypothetical protein
MWGATGSSSLPSWPGLSRPSTRCSSVIPRCEEDKKVVDGRDKPGHDERVCEVSCAATAAATTMVLDTAA